MGVDQRVAAGGKECLLHLTDEHVVRADAF
jgi:hypothetical protein